MSKTELVTNVMKATGETRLVCDKVVDAFIDELKDAICRGEKISLKNLMTIEIGERAAREARNPATGEIQMFPAVKTVKCKISTAIKKALNGKE